MSLADRFNPNDGSANDRMDNALFELSKKLAKKWQDNTGYNKRVLEEMLYSGSFALFGTNAVQTGHSGAVVLAAMAGLKSIAHLYTSRRSSALEEQMSAEASGLPSKTPKFFSLAIFHVGLASVVNGIANLAAGAIGGHGQYYFNATDSLTLGIGTLAWLTAEYMTKSDIGVPPPRKPILARLKAMIKSLTPRPAPAYSTANSS